jgi:hypothetical protein
MAAETMKLPNKTVERLYKALVALSRRTLPSIQSDLKVAKLRRYFAPLAEPIEEARQKKLIENSVEVAGESQIQNAAAIASANLEIADALCEFTKPSIAILESDLPKELKGEPSAANPFAGSGNATGRAEIISELDFLFELGSAVDVQG